MHSFMDKAEITQGIFERTINLNGLKESKKASLNESLGRFAAWANYKDDLINSESEIRSMFTKQN